MRWWRPAMLLLLWTLPLLLVMAVGTWSLWMDRRWGWLWWLLPTCWALALLLARIWRPTPPQPTPLDPLAPTYWTATDRQALEIVERHQRDVSQIDPSRLVDPHFYLDAAQRLALEIARLYHPRATDPFTSLTVPEILAAANLVLRDLEGWTAHYVPGSHLLTVRQWRRLARAPDWLRTVRDLGWLVSLLVRPSRAGRVLLSRLTADSAQRHIQANVLAAFYLRFVREVGFYAIEMNSGRLRSGTQRYLELQEEAAQRGTSIHEPGVRSKTARGASPPAPSADDRQPLSLAVIGQAGAGKSSLVQALAGSRTAQVEATAAGRRYRFRLGPERETIVLVDTPGYASPDWSARDDAQLDAVCEETDCILLVLNATSPARQADAAQVERIGRRLEEASHRRAPPILAVLTHVDLLPPVLQWHPPYNWQEPQSAKEQSIHEALKYNASVFAGRLVGMVPVCLAAEEGRRYGVDQWLLPALAAVLDEGRATAVVRRLHDSADRDRLPQLGRQLRNIGREILRASLAVGRS